MTALQIAQCSIHVPVPPGINNILSIWLCFGNDLLGTRQVISVCVLQEQAAQENWSQTRHR